MEFNTLVKTRLLPILRRHGFEIAEELRNILRFQSSVIEINFVCDYFEKHCYVSIGRNGESLHELRDNAVKALLNSSLPIEQVTQEVFVQNLSSLFESKEGAQMLKGDIDAFINFKMSEDNHYASELMLEQSLEIAAKAWDNNDYAAFVEAIGKIEINKIPQSYQLKYKMAKKKLEEGGNKA